MEVYLGILRYISVGNNIRKAREDNQYLQFPFPSKTDCVSEVSFRSSHKAMTVRLETDEKKQHPENHVNPV